MLIGFTIGQIINKTVTFARDFFFTFYIVSFPMRNISIVVFDGTSHFVDDAGYVLMDDEKVVYRGSFEECVEVCEKLNSEL